MREAREAAKFTQAEVAAELGVSRQVVTKWESGRSAPNPVQVAKLCMLLGVTTDSVLLGMQTDAEQVLRSVLAPRDLADSS